MIVPFPSHNSIKIAIPTKRLFLFLLIIISALVLLSFSSLEKSVDSNANNVDNIDRETTTTTTRRGTREATMKVHPMPSKKRNITVQYNLNPARNPSQTLVGVHKKLRRLPHIFSRVLELPFRADADVEVEEGPDFFRFVAETDGIGSDVRAHTVEIHPGVTKIVVRPNGSLELLSLDQLELDMWRFRLPESTRPELASAVCVDGELIVTVPKDEDEEGEDEGQEAVEGGGGGRVRGRGGEGGVWGGGNGSRLVIVQ